MIFLGVIAACLAALVALLVVSARPSAPLRSVAARRAVLALAGLGATLVVAATAFDFWEVTEAESEVTARYAVGATSGANLVAWLGILGASVVVAAATTGRRSFAGLAAASAWLLVGVVWVNYLIDDSSSRSSADLGPGPSVLTSAVVALSLAATVRWIAARAERRSGSDRLRPPAKASRLPRELR